MTSRRAIEMRLDRIGDPDAADQQCREPDQGEVLREALDVLRSEGDALAARCESPSRLRGNCACAAAVDGAQGIGLHARGQPQPIMPAHHAAGLQQARSRATLLR